MRLDVAKNELLPVLNMILSTYVSGLQGESNIGTAIGDQFSVGRPTYSAGLVAEYPLGNRAAQAKFRKRQLEIRQLTNRLAATTLNVRLEVDNAVREIQTTYREMACQANAVVGNQAEIAYLKARWEASLDDQRPAGVVLDDLLNAQDRLARAEGLYAAALVAYNSGFASLNRATGTLISFQQFACTAPGARMPMSLQRWPVGANPVPSIPGAGPMQQAAKPANPYLSVQTPADGPKLNAAGPAPASQPVAAANTRTQPASNTNPLQQPAVSYSPWSATAANPAPQATPAPVANENSLQQPASLNQAGRGPALLR